jgi:hypothetical protein
MSIEIVSRISERAVVWCMQCGAGFSKSKMGREYERHVKDCAERHAEDLRSQSYRVKNPHLFDPLVSGDVELGAWIRANKRAILEGRRRI